MEAKRRGELGDVEIVVMCRSNRSDIDVTVKTLRDAGIEPREVTFFIFTSGSDLHLKYKIGKTLLRYEGREEREWLDLPLSFYRDANIRLQCDAIRARARVRSRANRVRRGGRKPRRRRLLHRIFQSRLRSRRDSSRVAGHGRHADARSDALVLLAHRRGVARTGCRSSRTCTTTTDSGTINAITATSCGFKVISVTANGYGERAGNVKLHEFVVALRVLYGIELPGFKYGKLRELARFMERMSGIPLQQHEPIVGAKVFAHESGIHTQAMLIDHRMYEAVPGELVGGRDELGLRQTHRSRAG